MSWMFCWMMPARRPDEDGIRLRQVELREVLHADADIAAQIPAALRRLDDRRQAVGNASEAGAGTKIGGVCRSADDVAAARRRGGL